MNDLAERILARRMSGARMMFGFAEEGSSPDTTASEIQ
jgi:hypothetical protein